jgi:hypothetical protein
LHESNGQVTKARLTLKRIERNCLLFTMISLRPIFDLLHIQGVGLPLADQFSCRRDHRD